MNAPEFESLDQAADATADALVRAAAGSAFDLFRDTEFTRLASLAQLSQTEQDRIFRRSSCSCRFRPPPSAAITMSVAATRTDGMSCSR